MTSVHVHVCFIACLAAPQCVGWEVLLKWNEWNINLRMVEEGIMSFDWCLLALKRTAYIVCEWVTSGFLRGQL